LSKSRESRLDLVEIAAQASPPVCRIMDYGKYMYQQSKREREARKKHKTSELKEIRMRPSIEEHDYQVKLRNAEKFLGKGDKIKVSVMFRGREMAHREIGRKVLMKLAGDVEALSRIEREPRVEGRYMTMFLSPK
jgi:translation initiation factor IF-3